MKYVPHIKFFISREEDSRGWLGDLKGIWQEQGPMVSAADVLSKEEISLPVTDSCHSKRPGERSNLFTILQQNLNISM